MNRFLQSVQWILSVCENRPGLFLLFGGLVLVGVIVFSLVGLFPLNLWLFVPLFLLCIGISYAVPEKVFYFLILFIPLEIVTVGYIGNIGFRPYQLFAASLAIAFVLLFFQKKFPRPIFSIQWYDVLVVIFLAASCLSLFGAPELAVSIKQVAVLGSFILLYALVRYFVRTGKEIFQLVPFVSVSAIIVQFYGIWQNWRSQHDLESFQRILGRPNGTFFEADWFGLYGVVILAVLLGVFYYRSQTEKTTEGLFPSFTFKKLYTAVKQFRRWNMTLVALYSILLTTLVAIVISVARSAWVGALAVTLIFFLALVSSGSRNFSEWNMQRGVRYGIRFGGIFLAALLIIFVFDLTNFQLKNRITSTASGYQEITISCDEKTDRLPEKISNTSLLFQYGCQHIDLEEIKQEKDAGKYVTTIFRLDPNVEVRKSIYGQTVELIKDHWLIGIGWGSSSFYLGRDESGTPLNTSNIFLEVWLSSGIIGFMAFVTMMGAIGIGSGKLFLSRAGNGARVAGLAVFLLWLAIIIPNLFNAGILLAFFWLFLGVALPTASYGLKKT